MAEKEHESPLRTAPANGHDAEAPAAAATVSHSVRDKRKIRLTRCLVFLLLFLIFHAAIVAVFALTILRVRTPRFRVQSATFNDLNVGTPANPSFGGRMNAELTIRNKNFGRYKYRDDTVYFYYRDSQVGEAVVRRSRANWRSTKKFEIGVDLNLANGQANSQLAGDLSAGIVPLSCRGRLKGRVEVVFLVKKSRSAEMNCSMEIVTATRQLRNIMCK